MKTYIKHKHSQKIKNSPISFPFQLNFLIIVLLANQCVLCSPTIHQRRRWKLLVNLVVCWMMRMALCYLNIGKKMNFHQPNLFWNVRLQIFPSFFSKMKTNLKKLYDLIFKGVVDEIWNVEVDGRSCNRSVVKFNGGGIIDKEPLLSPTLMTIFCSHECLVSSISWSLSVNSSTSSSKPQTSTSGSFSLCSHTFSSSNWTPENSFSKL